MRTVVGASLASLKILAVEDHRDTRLLLKMILQLSGAEVTALGSGRAALEAIQQLKPDVILCDLRMPQMDGFELLQKIRGLGGEVGNVPAIACTALGNEEDMIRTQRAGFQAHVTKPLDAKRLVETIVKVVGCKLKTG
jgi:CheY-like chemotaxis protein